MNRKAAILITIIIAIFAIAVPLVLVIKQASNNEIESEKSKIAGYARELLVRSENTADVFLRVESVLEPLIDKAGTCGEENLNLLEQSALSVSHIQALGFVSGNHLVCSTFGDEMALVDLGAAAYTSKLFGISRVWADVKFPFTGDVRYVVLEKNGLAGIIHEGTPLSVSVLNSDILLATVNISHQVILVKKGAINPDWMENLPEDGDVKTFVSDGYVIGIVSSTRYDFASIAAIPAGNLNQRLAEITRYLIPVALAATVLVVLSIIALSRQQVALPQAIKAALKSDEFFLEYQPIVDLQSGRWVGAEALLRWQRSNGEMIKPDIFIPIAEEAGLMNLITQRVLALIAEDAEELFLQFPNFYLSINLSSSDLHGKDIVDKLATLQKQIGAGPDNLCVEVTERNISVPELARPVLHQLRDLGIATAVDDFGTGYSSLAYLESFDFDVLKIDKAFVDTLDKDGELVTATVVQHIVQMAKTLRLSVVAEGVETARQRQALTEMGVQFSQGWYFSKAVKYRELFDKISTT